jgi:hypothetical protein
MRTYARTELSWKGNDLCLGRDGVVSIVPDGRWPAMWRVRRHGSLSDMVNLTRAKDAAVSIALREFNMPSARLAAAA